MDLITGVISLVVFLGSLAYLPNKGSGFMTTAVSFASFLTGLMAMMGNWNWWWTVPLGFVGIFLISMITAQVGSFIQVAAFLKKFLPLSTILSLILILTTAIPGLKTTFAPNISLGLAGTIWAICGIMLLFAIGISLGAGNVILGIISIVNIIKENPARLAVVLLGLIYASVYFSVSADQMYKWVTGAALTNATLLWVLQLVGVGIGIVLAVAIFSATLTNLPNNMSFFTRFKQIFVGSWAKFAFKGLFSVSLVAGLIYALVQLGFIQFLYSVGNILTSTIQIICVLAVLFGVFKYIISNPRLLATIKNNIFIQLLFTIVMIIPCLLVHLAQSAGIGASFAAKVKAASPPKMVFMVLAVEILLVSSYIVLPMFRKWIYTYTPGSGGDLVLQQRIVGTQNAILAMQKKFIKDASVGDTQLSNVNWEKVYSEQLYLTDDAHTKALKAYLTTLGYKDNYNALRDNKLISDVLGKPITLGSAVSFIQTKNRVDTILDNSLNLDHLKNKLEALENQPEEGGSFNSEILNNKPTYINKKTNIGLYENLKGQSSSKFSQNKVTTQSSDSADDYNYNYGLSSWIFLMAQPPSFGVGYSKFTKVLDYAGKPTIWYNPEINTLKITTNAYKKDNSTPYEKTVYKTTKLPLQKWNNIVINFVGGTLDVFINKDLVASVSNLIPYMSNDAINIGDNPGISGAVANVTYFSRPVSQQKIKFFYNNLVNKDPPIV